MLATVRRIMEADVTASAGTPRGEALAAQLEAAQQRSRVALGLLAAAMNRGDLPAMADAASQASLDLGALAGFARLLAREP